MYKSIVIIGLGSLGGFVAENISRIEGLQSLILIDPDIVESKNIGKSIYRRKDVNKRKVDVLKDIIQGNNENLIIKVFPIEYIEEKIYMPESDLVIDCRDMICNRSGNIDVRLYISFKTLIIDCKKYYKVIKSITGRYIHQLKKIDLAGAAMMAVQIINSGKIKELMRKELLHQINLDHLSVQATKSIQAYNNLPDIVIDYSKEEKQIKNLYENIPKIIKANKNNELTVVIGNVGFLGDTIQKISKKEITNYNNAVSIITNITKSINLPYESYTIAVNNVSSGKVYLELLPETGGA